MKYCLSSRQNKEYLTKADQIKVQYRDRKSIPDLIIDYPDKEIILENPTGEELDWNDLKLWKTLSKDNLILSLLEVRQLTEAVKMGFKAYFGWTINDFETLRTVLNMGVCYVKISGPLFFDLDNVNKIAGNKIRITANVAFDDGLPREDGVVGTYIRPEDVDVYANYVDSIEFEDCDLTKEQTLYRIYAEKKAWPGELGMLITNFNYVGTNRMIPSSFGLARLSCKQKCQSTSSCRACYRILELANPEKMKALIKK
jgi:hypothetical protein